MAARRHESLFDTDASAATPWPSAASPTLRCLTPAPSRMTTAAQSLPGMPGSPGYAPRMLSTSRKLMPTARTASCASPRGGSA
eukprot:scaffold9691_cov113-Isochrysis_galbana.AAC.4